MYNKQKSNFLLCSYSNTIIVWIWSNILTVDQGLDELLHVTFYLRSIESKDSANVL